LEALTAGPSSNATANSSNVTISTKPTGTDYVILQRVEAKDGGEAWKIVDATTTGGGSDAAIRHSREGKKGGYKAVPVRNWRGGLDLDTETRAVTVTKPIRD
jgi:hypothetical protein